MAEPKLGPYEISNELINAIFLYLKTRPYGEVVDLINGINSEIIPQIQAEKSPQASQLNEDPNDNIFRNRKQRRSKKKIKQKEESK